VEDEPTAELEPVVAEGGESSWDEDEAAIDHFDDVEDLEHMQEELDYMMEEEGMTVNISG
jgi:hypothetical protein